MRKTDKEILDWLEEQHTLHYSVEFLYVVDGYEVQLLYDGNVQPPTFHGKDLRAAITVAMEYGRA